MCGNMMCWNQSRRGDEDEIDRQFYSAWRSISITCDETGGCERRSGRWTAVTSAGMQLTDCHRPADALCATGRLRAAGCGKNCSD